MKFDELFFVASAWNTGNAVYIDGYDFLLTTTQTVGFSKVVLLQNFNTKKTSKVLFSDFKNGVAIIEKVVKQNSLLNILNFELSAYDQNALIYQKNIFNEIQQFTCEIRKKDDILQIVSNHSKALIDGALVYSKRGEFLGIVTKKNNKPELIAAKYLMKMIEEFSDINKEAVRCLKCNNIVEKHSIKDKHCPVCGNVFLKEITDDILPPYDQTAKMIERLLVKMNYHPELVRYGKNFWNITKGSASIFIRYNPQTKFIAAFSPLYKIKNNSEKIFKYLISENSNLQFLSFSYHNNFVYLNAPYFITNYFSEKNLEKILCDLFKLADKYDDILMELDN